MAALTLDPSYGYVVLAATSTFVVRNQPLFCLFREPVAFRINTPTAPSPSPRLRTSSNHEPIQMNMIHMVNTGSYRKIAKVPYPAAYAPPSRTDEDANRFNCAQRSHAHYIENQVPLLGSLMLAGLRYPLVSAGLGVGWTVSRYVYMVGYCQGGDGKGRYKGMTSWLFQLGLLGLSGYTGLAMVMEW
ncbi:hypothetical protein JHW43_002245 [Diplocarpon mali]|nr:hypothetical protein JHW43_002245 [Diplocarpon mali]